MRKPFWRDDDDNHWHSLESSSSSLGCLSSETGIPASALIDISKGGDPQQQGTRSSSIYTGFLRSVQFFTDLFDSSNTLLAQMVKGSLPDGRDVVDVISAGDNDQRGTWVHPEVAIQIAQWISPEYAQMVSSVMLRYHRGDLSVAAEALANYDARHGTTSTMVIDTHLGKRKADLELDDLEAGVAEKRARAAAMMADARRVEAETLQTFLAFLAPAEGCSEIERIRAESDVATVRARLVKTLAGDDAAPRALTDGRGTEISVALIEQKMGVRLTKQERVRVGKLLKELVQQRRGPEYTIPKREEFVDGRVIMVNAYWSQDEDLMREAVQRVLRDRSKQ